LGFEFWVVALDAGNVSSIERFEDIQAWQSARELRRAVYGLTRSKPFSADFALVDKIRRAAISVSSNIAEGFERGGNRELIQFLATAKGPAGEIKDQLTCALDEGYITVIQFDEIYRLAEKTSRAVGAFMTYLRNSEITGHKFDTYSTRANPKLKTQNSKPISGHVVP
jgi:four helix bundle protein